MNIVLAVARQNVRSHTITLEILVQIFYLEHNCSKIFTIVTYQRFRPYILIKKKLKKVPQMFLTSFITQSVVSSSWRSVETSHWWYPECTRRLQWHLVMSTRPLYSVLSGSVTLPPAVIGWIWNWEYHKFKYIQYLKLKIKRRRWIGGFSRLFLR